MRAKALLDNVAPNCKPEELNPVASTGFRAFPKRQPDQARVMSWQYQGEN